MIRWDVDQGTDDWLRLRAGIPTSSEYGKLVNPTGKISKQADEYVNKCIVEMIEGTPLTTFVKSFWMERGNDMESEAAGWYSFDTGRDVIDAGFVTDDLMRWGASPDRLVVEDGEIVGGLEIKCPAPWNHLENVLRNGISTVYYPQVQGQILVCGLDWVDWVSYHPNYLGMYVRILPDLDYQAKLASRLEWFHETKLERIESLVEKGILRQAPTAPQEALKRLAVKA